MTTKPKKDASAKENGRKVIYPEVTVQIADARSPITVEQSKDLLSWQEETAEVKFGSDYLLVDRNGNKVRCLNNLTNRPLYMSSVNGLVQEHLRKRWKFNGEPLIISKTGEVLNGQHSLLAHVLSEQERTGKNKAHWADYWNGPVTMEKLVVFGVDGSDEIVNTMDTCKPRSLADVIYRSEYFADKTGGQRKTLSRMADYCIRLLWNRTGVSKEAFAPRMRTHAESLDFLARHPRILECVKHIYEENGDAANRIGKYLSPGYASGVLYLMGSSSSDLDEYTNADPPSEKKTTWDNWDRACEFWVLLASKDSLSFQNLRYTIGKPIAAEFAREGDTQLEDEGDASVSYEEKMAIFARAWAAFVEGGKELTKADCSIADLYMTDDDGIRHLKEHPQFGGIDQGEPVKEKSESPAPSPNPEPSIEASEEPPTPEPESNPTPEEINERAEKEREQREAAKANGKGKRKGANAAATPPVPATTAKPAATPPAPKTTAKPTTPPATPAKKPPQPKKKPQPAAVSK